MAVKSSLNRHILRVKKAERAGFKPPFPCGKHTLQASALYDLIQELDFSIGAMHYRNNSAAPESAGALARA